MVTHMKKHGKPAPFRDVVVDAPGQAGDIGIVRGASDIRRAVSAKMSDLRETGRGPGWLRGQTKTWWPPADPLKGRSGFLFKLRHTSAREAVGLLTKLFRIAHTSEGAPAPEDETQSAVEALVASQWAGPFDRSLLSSFSERPLFADPAPVLVIDGTTTRRCRLMLTDKSVYLQATQIDNPTGFAPPPSFAYNRMTRVWRRRRFMQELGLEVISGTGAGSTGVLLEFRTVEERERVFTEVAQRTAAGVAIGEAILVPLGGEVFRAEDEFASAASASASSAGSAEAGTARIRGGSNAELSAALRTVGWVDRGLARAVVDKCRQWQEGGCSNFEYLSFLNAAAGRTVRDFSQYPVMPWVVADHTSSKLDLSSHKTFRDLAKPVGALTASRIDSLRERLKHMPDVEGEGAPFLYGTHYSSPGYVMYYRVSSRWLLLCTSLALSPH
jgi:factor associated with neutral sphingomyelinase activation